MCQGLRQGGGPSEGVKAGAGAGLLSALDPLPALDLYLGEGILPFRACQPDRACRKLSTPADEYSRAESATNHTASY